MIYIFIVVFIAFWLGVAVMACFARGAYKRGWKDGALQSDKEWWEANTKSRYEWARRVAKEGKDKYRSER